MHRNESTTYLLADILSAITDAALVDATLARILAQCVLARLQERHGGERLYVPAKPVTVALHEQVKAAIASGEPVRTAHRRLGISRSAFYRLAQGHWSADKW